MIHTAKIEARQQAMLRREAAHALGKGQAAAQYLKHFLGPFRGSVIAGYLPMRSEIDPLAAMASFAEDGPVCVPEIVGKGLPLVFRRWTPDAALVDGPFGTKRPEQGEILQPSVLIVPLLAYDLAFYRLGYGGGFYDRTIANLRAQGPLYAVGLAYEAQLDRKLPVGPHDQALDAIVTERAVLTRRGSDA